METNNKPSDRNTDLQSLRENIRELSAMLRESEERYRALTDASLQGIVIVQGLPIRLVYASRLVTEILGYSNEEILSASPDQIHNFMYGEDRPAFLDKYEGRLEGRNVPPRYEARVMRKDGDLRWLEIFSSRIEYDGQPAVQAAFVDITERKRIEQALRESEGKYRRIFENVQDVFYQVDRQGNILDISPSIERYSEYSREELIGRPVTDVYANPSDRDKLIIAISKHGEVIDYELQLKSRSGGTIATSVNAHVLYRDRKSVV